jgi:hypothetical protein
LTGRYPTSEYDSWKSSTTGSRAVYCKWRRTLQRSAIACQSNSPPKFYLHLWYGSTSKRPRCLVFRQAAQQLQGAAAAQGGLPAAAALLPLMQLQQLAQSIGSSTNMDSTQLTQPPHAHTQGEASAKSSAFSSLDTCRQSLVQPPAMSGPIPVLDKVPPSPTCTCPFPLARISILSAAAQPSATSMTSFRTSASAKGFKDAKGWGGGGALHLCAFVLLGGL